MAFELDKVNADIVSVVEKHEIGDIIKPLINEIHLFDTYVAGTNYIDDDSILDNIKINDDLKLQREDNKFDKKAILVLNNANQKIGYVPQKDNIIFSRMMDAGKLLKAKVKDIKKKGSYVHIFIGIYLVDF